MRTSALHPAIRQSAGIRAFSFNSAARSGDNDCINPSAPASCRRGSAMPPLPAWICCALLFPVTAADPVAPRRRRWSCGSAARSCCAAATATRRSPVSSRVSNSIPTWPATTSASPPPTPTWGRITSPSLHLGRYVRQTARSPRRAAALCGHAAAARTAGSGHAVSTNASSPTRRITKNWRRNIWCTATAVSWRSTRRGGRVSRTPQPRPWSVSIGLPAGGAARS